MTPAISVITVVRNDVGGLRRTVDSVQEQDRSAFEHVIWDGASTDGTAEWIEGHAPRLPNTTWRSQQDAGIYDAMNQATALASGEILLYLNAGDTLSGANVLRFVADDQQTHRWRWAYGRTQRWRGSDFVDCPDQRPFRLSRFIAGSLWVPHQATFVSREDFHRLGGFDVAAGLAADQDLLLRFALESLPHTWDRVIADFELDGAHTRATQRSRETEWRRMRDKNIPRSWAASRADAARTETRIWYLTLRFRARPFKAWLRTRFGFTVKAENRTRRFASPAVSDFDRKAR